MVKANKKATSNPHAHLRVHSHPNTPNANPGNKPELTGDLTSLYTAVIQHHLEIALLYHCPAWDGRTLGLMAGMDRELRMQYAGF